MLSCYIWNISYPKHIDSMISLVAVVVPIHKTWICHAWSYYGNCCPINCTWNVRTLCIVIPLVWFKIMIYSSCSNAMLTYQDSQAGLQSRETPVLPSAFPPGTWETWGIVGQGCEWSQSSRHGLTLTLAACLWENLPPLRCFQERLQLHRILGP